MSCILEQTTSYHQKLQSALRARTMHFMLELRRSKKMNKNKNKMKKDLGREQQKRLFEAKENLKKIQNKISPFIKPRKFKEHSTAGKWCQTSSLYK